MDLDRLGRQLDSGDRDRASLDNHHQVTYFLGAGFASCYGLPVARDLQALLVRQLWPVKWKFREFIEGHFGCVTEIDAAALAFSDVLDAIERVVKSGATEVGHARAALTEIEWTIREEFGVPDDLERWWPKSAQIDRLFRFLVSNGHHNFLLTTNWDTYLDLAVQTFLTPPDKRPLSHVDYGLYPQDELYNGQAYVPIHLFKMNGSVDWLWCGQCRKIFGGFLPWPFATYGAIRRNPFPTALEDAFLCGLCGTTVRQLMVMPSPERPQHLLSIGHQWEQEFRKEHTVLIEDGIEVDALLEKYSAMLQASTFWVFMGYSLPEYDRDTLNVIGRALSRRAEYTPDYPLTIHVVGFEPDFKSRDSSQICRRYAEVLRRDFEYFPDGVEAWIDRYVPDRPRKGTEQPDRA